MKKIWFVKLIPLFSVFLFCFSVSAQDMVEANRGQYQSGELTGNATMSPGDRIHIVSTNFLSGSIAVKTHKESRAVFNFRKLIKIEGKSNAIDYANMVGISMENAGSEVRLYLQTPNPAPWSGTDNSVKISGTLTIPEGCEVEFEAVYFDVSMDGVFKSVKNRSSFGKLMISGVEEELDVSSSNRDIVARNIKGEISISTSYADIDIQNMESDGPAAYIRNENGNITIGDFVGAFDVRNDFGRIKIDDAVLTDERSRIRGSYSPIRISIAKMDEAGLTIRNNNEDIELSVPVKSSVDYSLKVEGNGEINAEGLDIIPTYVDYNRLDFKTGDGDSRVRVSVGGKGNINISGY